jgi:ketosteroid isomerase-like protein
MTIASDLLQRHFQTLVQDNSLWQTLIADDLVWELPYAPAIGHPARLSGRDEVVRHVTWFLGAVENFRFFDATVHPFADPGGAVASVKAEAVIKATGRTYRQEYVVFLRALGYVEGQNLTLERRSAEERFERFGDIVAELVRLKADVIVTVADLIVRAAKAVTTTVPIVMATSGDPVGEGFVQSLARPGGNITGLTVRAGPEIGAKRLELLRMPCPESLASPTLRARKTKSGKAHLGRAFGRLRRFWA